MLELEGAFWASENALSRTSWGTGLGRKARAECRVVRRVSRDATSSEFKAGLGLRSRFEALGSFPVGADVSMALTLRISGFSSRVVLDISVVKAAVGAVASIAIIRLMDLL